MEYLDSLDPDWTFAAKHGKANNPGKPIYQPKTTASISLNKQQNHIYCQCCLNIINKEQVPLCENSKELGFLGFGFPLYFIFNKYAIILLILQIVSYSALALYWALQSTKDICEEGAYRILPGGQKGVCTSWLIKFVRSEPSVTDEELILRLCSFFIQLLGLVYIRDMVNKTRKYYDERSTLISHYAIMFSNLPKQTGINKKIRQFMKKGFDDAEYVVEELVAINELTEYFNIRESKMKVIKEKQEWLNKQVSQQRQNRIQELDELIIQKQNLIELQYEKQMNNIKNDQVLCQKAIIIVASQELRKEIVHKSEKMSPQVWKQYFGQNAININLARAPQPKQIMWQNINYPNEKRVIRLLIGWSLTFGLIAVVTGIFYGILYGKGKAVDSQLNKIAQNPDSPQVKSLQSQSLAATFLTMLLIIIFNKFCISYILHLFTDIEKHRTGSQFQFSFGLKYTLGLFFTTALMTIFVQDFGFNNIYSRKYGVLQQQSIMFFFNSFLIPIIWIIHPWQIFKIIKRKIYFGRKDLTQRQANDLMQNSKYSVGKKYAQVTESIWFTYLYSSIIPGGTVLMTIGFCIFYWVDKRVLLRFSSINQNVNGQLSIRSVKLLDATLILRALGQIIFDTQIRTGATWQSYLCLAIGLFYIILPMDTILDIFHGQKFKSQQKPYHEAKKDFVQNYYSMNPLLFKFRQEMITSLKQTIIVSKMNIGGSRKSLAPYSSRKIHNDQHLSISNNRLDCAGIS